MTYVCVPPSQKVAVHRDALSLVQASTPDACGDACMGETTAVTGDPADMLGTVADAGAPNDIREIACVEANDPVTNMRLEVPTS
ncbi:unnamed protein product [Dicrocoelium dendriticum]|nr:unnamed protein product [Dicrocoelium dendriticum]